MSSCPLPPFLLNAFHTLRRLSFVCLFACFDMFACLCFVCDIFKRNSCPLPRFLPNAFHCLVLAHCDKFLPFASFVCLFANINMNELFSRNLKPNQMKVLPKRMLQQLQQNHDLLCRKMHPGLCGNLWIPMLCFYQRCLFVCCYWFCNTHGNSLAIFFANCLLNPWRPIVYSVLFQLE